VFCGRNFSKPIFLKFYFFHLSIHISFKSWYLWKMTGYQLEIFEYAEKSFTYVAEALTPLLRPGSFSWTVTHIIW